MSKISDAQTTIGWLEDGQLAADMTDTQRELLAHLRGLTDGRPKAKAKGQITLTIDYEVEGVTVSIDADIKVKKPRLPRAMTTAFVLEDASLSTQHPKQIDMFPAVVARRSRDAAEA